MLSIIIRLILLFIVNDNLDMNVDEESNYTIAFNNVNGHGYSLYDEKTASYRSVAFHASFPVLVYEMLITNGILKEKWTLFIYLITILLFIPSAFCFYRISLLALKNEKFAQWSLISYCFYPSVVYFIGTMFLYENLALYIMIIVICHLLCEKKKMHRYSFLYVPAAIAVSCLFRPQTIVFYFLILLVSGVYFIYRKYYSNIRIIVYSIILTFILHVPVLNKNKKQFGEYILSTQPGFELLQGHSPVARGSWMGNWKNAESDLYKYVHENVKDLELMNELEESNARKKMAIDWILAHPADELKLIGRKIAIYFLPSNYEVLLGATLFNPVNLFAHLGFLVFLLRLIIKKSYSYNLIMLILPLVASLTLSIIFFVGYRWRFYAEPFMLLCAWRLVFEFAKRKKEIKHYELPQPSALSM